MVSGPAGTRSTPTYYWPIPPLSAGQKKPSGNEATPTPNNTVGSTATHRLTRSKKMRHLYADVSFQITVKMKLSQNTPCKHMGEWRYTSTHSESRVCVCVCSVCVCVWCVCVCVWCVCVCVCVCGCCVCVWV